MAPIDRDVLAHQIADGAADVNTWQAWRQFTDLGAWDEIDSDTWVGQAVMAALKTDEPWQLPRLPLYAIAYRLATALLASSPRTWTHERRSGCTPCGSGGRCATSPAWARTLPCAGSPCPTP